ncbi:MAG: pitrilysin family protein [bacterium]
MSVNHGISNSGFSVFHYKLKDAPTCQTQIFVRAGSAHEDDDSLGVAHFLEHLCFQGTPTKDKHQMSREMSLAGNANAYTNNFVTSYYIETLKEDIETGFSLIKEAVFDSCFPEKEFEKEKNVIIEEWRMYDNYPSEYFHDKVMTNSFGEKDMHAIIGTEDSIRQMNPEKLHRFRNKWYGKNNMSIVFVGDLEFEEAMEIANKHLPEYSSSEESFSCLNEFLPKQEKFLFETDRFEQSAYGLITKWPSSKENHQNNLIGNFFSFCLSNYMYEYIRDDLGLCYGVSSSKIKHLDNSYNLISMLTRNDYLEKAEKELEKLFQKIKEEGFPKQIFEISKKKILFSQMKTLADVGSICYAIIAGCFTDKDGSWFLEKGQSTLNPDWVKKSAEMLTEGSLKKFANEQLNDFTKFSMFSKK